MDDETSLDHSAVAGGEAVSIPSLGQSVRALGGVLSPRPALAAELRGLPRQAVEITWGTSTVIPADDRRFSDQGWDTPIFRRLAQTYLAASGAVHRLVEDKVTEQDHHAGERTRFASELALAALSPANLLLTNPVGLKRAVETRGASVVRGVSHMVSDLRYNGGLPTTVDRAPFQVGRDLALTPGSVVERDDMAELLQYEPTRDRVHARPLLVVPPPIGRFYFLDLRPGRSFVEYATACGYQVFLVSWRNPGPAQGDWNLNDYASRVSRAVDTVLEVTGQDDLNLMGFCAGGIISTTLLNKMAHSDDERVHSMSYGVTLLDFSEKAPLAAFRSPRLLELARRRSGRAGVITSQQMGAAFALMRPNDLVFNYVVNNYVMGDKPPAFDILAWNADGTNLPGQLHAEFLDIFRHNSIVSGDLAVLGEEQDLQSVKVPHFVTGALTDHLTPWKGCYRTTQMLGGESTFVLSYSGHIASLVNPPGNPKAHYWTGGEPGADPEVWRSSAERRSGSWWEAWAAWLEPHAGDLVAAPGRLGSTIHPPLDPAPGRYVRARPAS